MRYYSSPWIKAHWGVFDTQGNRDVPYATMDTEEIAINVTSIRFLDPYAPEPADAPAPDA